MSESPLGEADGSTDNSNKDSSVECPTCGRTDFTNQYGMKQHHAKVHDESLNRVVLECAYCGSDVEKEKHNVSSYDRVFCDRDCKSSWWSENRSGEDSPQHNPDSYVTRECVHCGSDFKIGKWEIERRGKSAGRYCSKACMDDWRSENWVGENNPLHDGHTVECANCGEEFEKRRAKAERHERQYCSRECHGEWLSKNNTRERHPRWKGGAVGDYGERWSRQRRRALKRDNYECVICGKGEGELGRRPDVHHIRPVRDFDDPNDAHDLDNLTTLCRKHHVAWEGLYLRPDTI